MRVITTVADLEAFLRDEGLWLTEARRSPVESDVPWWHVTLEKEGGKGWSWQGGGATLLDAIADALLAYAKRSGED